MRPFSAVRSLSRGVHTTQSGLAALSGRELAHSSALMHLCASSTLVHLVSRALCAAAKAPSTLGLPALMAARHTIFAQFAAGEVVGDVRRVARRLSESGVQCIVDHSTEEATGSNARRENLDAKLSLLSLLAADLSDACAFMPIKPTALVSPSLLERLTEVDATSASDSFAEALALLDEREQEELRHDMEGLRRLCAHARSVRIPLLFDAEQTHRQPAIRLLTRELAAEFNPSSAEPILYYTQQAYLQGAAASICSEMAHAKQRNYTFAVKLVRGAYRASESRTNPHYLQPSKADTDREYDTCVERLLHELAAAEGPQADERSRPCVALLLATHNRPSIERACHLMRDLGLAKANSRVHFAQILGMADDLTHTLGLSGFNALKLVPFGSFEEVLPWLLRRLEENQDALGASAAERPLLRGEIWRRLAAM
eukprot:CAMPEP_0119398132 /NCGR_PEP_ID=MMETSP1334-20130426/140687_1 /TAXON_ID=127549 /ORGANISM="Calcidiscus leptoporus, Strain RCC1130" /LENGTH=428 /DNA_ID=CAMNT_0007421987 /DNA_START=19 /DNA_END=1305 /DNA_ORIENTATION=+